MAHWAVMPEALAEKCVLAGAPAWTCPTCGAPWTRVIARKAEDRDDAGRTHSLPSQRMGKSPPPERGWQTQRTDTGRRPTCLCTEEPVPGVVLDPFGGAGTVALVAKRLGRDSIYIDLSPEYAHMAARRCFAQLEITGDTYEIVDTRTAEEAT